MSNNYKNKNETENRVSEIIDTVKEYTRSERHMEQNEDIISEEQKERFKEIQNERGERIENLTNKIVYGESYTQNEVENLEENYERAENYLKNNKEHMSSDDYNNLKEKQIKRQEQMNNYK